MHVVGTAGHVDHGKSALVTALTGIDPDRFEEEKRRGLTIDLGFAWLTLPSGREVGLVDVPGHERFIRNMLAGAGGVTACLFVVAANEGWMPQSAEHLTALEVLGISHGVVALTKADAVDAETLEIARLDVTEHLAPSRLAGAPMIACSAVTREGLDELAAALDDVLARAPGAPDAGRPRLWIDRVFTIAGAGTVVTGTGSGGWFRRGDEVELQPSGRRARIRTIQSHKREVDAIGPGNRVALNLAGLERHGARRGDAVVTPGRWRAVRTLDVLLTVPPASITDHGLPVGPKGSYLLHAGSAETPVRLRLLDAEEVGPGERAFARLHLRDPLPLTRGDRFVLRDAGRVATVGGGEIVDPLPDRGRAGTPEHVELLHRLHGAAPPDAARTLVERHGLLPAAEVVLRVGANAEGGVGSDLHRLGSLLVSPAHRDALAR